MGGLSVVAHERSRKRQGDLLPQVILEMSLSLQLSCLTDGVQSISVTVIPCRTTIRSLHKYVD